MHGNQVLISSTFYAHVFCMKVLCAASLVTFWLWQRDFGKKKLSYKKLVRKMLMKLTTGTAIRFYVKKTTNFCMRLRRLGPQLKPPQQIENQMNILGYFSISFSDLRLIKKIYEFHSDGFFRFKFLKVHMYT